MSAHQCPDDEMIAAYFDGLLSEGEQDLLYGEMSACSDCVAMLASVGVVIREAMTVPESFSVPPSVTAAAVALFEHQESRESVISIAVRWVQDALSPLADAIQPTLC